MIVLFDRDLDIIFGEPIFFFPMVYKIMKDERQRKVSMYAIVSYVFILVHKTLGFCGGMSSF